MKPTCLGLIGGGEQLGAVALKAADVGVERVVGYSRCRAETVEAAKRGLISDVATSARQVAELADFVVIAGRVSETVGLLRRLAGTLVKDTKYCTDLCTVKEPVVKAALSVGLAGRFAGSNVFARREQRGSAQAGRDQFSDTVVYVTPVGRDTDAANEVADFWKRVLHAAPVICDAETHDRLVGWTSHLPRAIASTLAITLAQHGPKGVTYDPEALVTTAAAVGDVESWADNLIHNRSSLIDAIGAAESGLQRLKSALEAGDAGAVQGWLMEGHRWRTEVDR